MNMMNPWERLRVPSKFQLQSVQFVRMAEGTHLSVLVIAGGPVKLDSMWQHRLTRLVRDRYMYSIRITV